MSHLDTDALADVLAGLGQPAHLDECADCQTSLTQLSTAMASVTVALAELPDPVVPAHLVERLDAALASERGEQSMAEAPAPSGTPALIAPARSATVTPIDVKSSGLPSWTKAAGGLAVAAGLVVGVVLVANKGGRTRDATSSASAEIARNDTGRAYTKDRAALSGELKALLKGNAPRQEAAPALGAAPLNPTSQQSAKADTRALSDVDALAPLRGKEGLAACLTSLSDPADPGIPRALDYGTFEGQPALLVILPSAKPNTVLAFFVGPACSAADSHLLYYEKVDVP